MFFRLGTLLLVLAVAACSGQNGSALAPVTPLRAPQLPPWIASVSPTQRATTLAQVRVIFAKPVATLGTLEATAPAEVLSHVRIDPALQGEFVLLTPRMIGFVPEQALPVGTRVRVTLTAGLRDLSGDALSHDLAWTFETTPLSFSDLPTTVVPPDSYEETPPPSNLNPTLTVTANARVDEASLSSHAWLAGGGQRIALDARLVAQPTPIPGSGATQAFDPSLNAWQYDLVPRATLREATTYQLVVDAGVAPSFGNVPTTQRFTGSIRTYAPLAIVATPTPSPGSYGQRFENGDPVLTFDNPLDPKSLSGNVTVSGVTSSQAATIPDDASNTIAIDPYLLSPSATYTVTVGTGLRDVFGQHFESAQTITLHTGDFTPGLWAPSGTNVFPNVDDLALNIFATNLPGNRYRSIFERVAPAMLVGADDPSSLLPDASRWPQRTIAGARPNAQSIVRVPLRAALGGDSGALAYGASVTLPGSNTITDTGLVSLTNLGIFVQSFPARAIVRLARLSDGAPVGGATVTFYRTGQRSSTVPCAQTTSDASGTAQISGNALQACYAGGASYPDEAPPFMVVASLGTDWAYARLEGWSGTENIDADTTWLGGAPLSRGTVFTDRQMYQPGESARITGIAYAVVNGTLQAERDASYSVKLTDPNGNTKAIGTAKTDDFGVFSLPLSFGANQMLGYYGIAATGPDGNEIDGGLRVAQFTPPNFALDVSVDRSTALAGTSVVASAQGRYLFGAPLAGAAATIDVTRDAASIAPPGWDDFFFGRQWFWPDEEPEFDTDVLQTTGTFDNDGHLSTTIPVAADLPLPMTYSVDVGATDVSHLSVDTTQTFTALASDGVIGVSSDVVGTAGKPLAVQIVVTDLAGKPLTGRTVHVTLQSMSYTAATQLVAGGESAQNGVQYTTVGSVDVTSASSPVTARLNPKTSGPYRIQANFPGAPAGSETDVQAFVVGAGSVNWGNENPTTVTVKLDKKRYRIGDTATALVASPFASSDIYFAVVRQDVLLSRLVHASGSATISFRVTPAMLPNVAVEAVVVRRGASIRTLHAGALDSLSRAGFATLHVDLSDRYLRVGISPEHPRVEPGATQQIAFRMRDASGHAAPGELVVMVVDDAILQLTGYRPPDLVQTIFADQPIPTRYADSRESVQLQPLTPPLEKGWGYGGGFLAGAGSTRVRENFNPLAYYAVLRVGASGTANVSFTLPDELTTWRVMAIGIANDDMHFGSGDGTFVATKTLLTNPLVPQFARPGDTIDAGLSALDVAGAAQLAVSGQVTGALHFASGAPDAVQATETLGSGLQAFRFPMLVGTPAPTTLLFSSRAGNATDAFRVPLAILDRSVTESVIESGVTTKTSDVPVDFRSGGHVTVTLANSVVPAFALPAGQAMAAQPEPFLDDAASRLVIASAVASLRERYHLHPSFDPIAAERAARASILALQQSDGGFEFFKGDGVSDPFESAYAAQAIGFASARGLDVDAHATANLKAYLARTLANPARYAWCTSALCRARMRFAALLGLAALGDRRSDFLSDIVAQDSSFDTATQERLAEYLLGTPGYRAQGSALAGVLEQSVYRTGRTATVSANDTWGWLGTPVQAQASMLTLLLARGAAADEIDGAVRALVAQQCHCGWGTLLGTAAAVQALAAYADHERLAPFTATLRAGTKTLATASFGSTAASKTFDVPASSVGAGTLAFASTGGTLHYALVYTYPVPENAPGELAGLRVIRTVRPVAQSAVLATMDLAAQSAPLTLSAGDVVDVGVQVIVDHPVDRLEIEDPLPAGFEAVDESLRTSSSAVLAQPDSWQIENEQIAADRVTAYAQDLEPGVYELHYLARAVTPGSYCWPGARAYLRDAPETFGRSAFSTLEIR